MSEHVADQVAALFWRTSEQNENLRKEIAALRAEVESLRMDKEEARALLTDCWKFIDQFSGKKSERLVRRIAAITSTQQSEAT